MSTVVPLFINSLIFYLVPIIIVLLIVIFVVKTIKRLEKRADEKLALEKENTKLLQSKVVDLEERLSVIEKMLKEVD
jgi:ABC-type bacteriocin/lantibiotic exporter with double-glycine peptidase domain